MNLRVRILRLGIIGMAGLVATSAFAWACTIQPAISTSPRTAAAGETVNVNGIGFQFPGEIDIRWDRTDGPVLATIPSALKFNVQITIPPDASPGAYYLVAVGRPMRNGQPVSTSGGTRASDTFEVVPSGVGVGQAAPLPAAQSASSDLWGALASGDPVSRSMPSVAAAPKSGPSQFTVGVGLLMVGLVGLFAGSAMALGRRSGSLARTPYRHRDG